MTKPAPALTDTASPEFARRTFAAAAAGAGGSVLATRVAMLTTLAIRWRINSALEVGVVWTVAGVANSAAANRKPKARRDGRQRLWRARSRGQKSMETANTNPNTGSEPTSGLPQTPDYSAISSFQTSGNFC